MSCVANKRSYRQRLLIVSIEHRKFPRKDMKRERGKEKKAGQASLAWPSLAINDQSDVRNKSYYFLLLTESSNLICKEAEKYETMEKRKTYFSGRLYASESF